MKRARKKFGDDAASPGLLSEGESNLSAQRAACVGEMNRRAGLGHSRSGAPDNGYAGNAQR